MTDDNSTFIREVNEDMRSDAAKAIWKRYKFVVIGAAAAIVLGTAATRGWQYWQETTAARSGDAFLTALDLARNGKNDEALAAMSALQTEGSGAYPVLARMRAATVLAAGGDKAAAISAFSAIGRDKSVPAAIGDVARLRAAYLLIDTGSYADVAAEAEVLAVAGNPSRHSAREALGFAAFKAGDIKRASEWFGEIAADTETPNGIATRAGVMLDLIAGRGGAS